MLKRYKIKKSNFAFTLILYKLIFDLIYNNVFVPIFSYNMGEVNFSIMKYLVSWVMYLIIIIILNRIKNEILNSSAFIAIIFAISPSLSIIGLKGVSWYTATIAYIYWTLLIVALFIMQYLKITERKKIEMLINNNAIISICNIILIPCALFIIFISGRYTGFRMFISLDVYDIRSDFAQISLPSIINYALVFVGYVFLPFIFTLYLEYKKYLLAIVTLFLGVMQFSLDGAKSILTIYLMIIGINFLYNRKKSYVSTMKYLTSGIISIMLLLWVFYIFGDITLAALMYRTFAIPQQISFNYVDFIRVNEALLLRDSILRHFAESPYGIRFSYFITGNKSNANNGLLGDAYANFKFLGVLIYPFAIAIVFKILEKFLVNFNKVTRISIITILFWNCLNSSYFTWLLSGGVILYMIVIYVVESAGFMGNKKG
ncbi:hypothetical protein E9840_08570 [Tissierella creatinini]|nr:hypothetical protein E9840_08570 [Tissierella creatinini]TJX61060.1 hypothetical protein E8P77_18910 [Soehngenia saccharolytica]